MRHELIFANKNVLMSAKGSVCVLTVEEKTVAAAAAANRHYLKCRAMSQLMALRLSLLVSFGMTCSCTLTRRTVIWDEGKAIR